MKKIILLLLVLFFSACTTQIKMGKLKKYNYNHKPYIELKFKRQQQREDNV